MLVIKNSDGGLLSTVYPEPYHMGYKSDLGRYLVALRPKIYETCLDSLEVGRLVGFLFPTVDSLICYFRSNSDVDHFKYPQWGFRNFVGAHNGPYHTTECAIRSVQRFA